MLADDAPFVELPIGTTEDRLVGSIDLAARCALTGGKVRFSPSLLAAAHGGVLYVDEVNLLPDHLVDVLLDVAVFRRQPGGAGGREPQPPEPVRCSLAP